MRLNLFRFALALLPLLYCLNTQAEEATPWVRVVSGRFEGVRENLLTAIEGRGIVINSVGHIGEMLDRTGADLGKQTKLYGAAEMFEFCSASASREMMAADPRNIVYCPYSISLYTLPNQPAAVQVAIRPLPDTPAFSAARALLQGILADAFD